MDGGRRPPARRGRWGAGSGRGMWVGQKAPPSGGLCGRGMCSEGSRALHDVSPTTLGFLTFVLRRNRNVRDSKDARVARLDRWRAKSGPGTQVGHQRGNRNIASWTAVGALLRGSGGGARGLAGGCGWVRRLRHLVDSAGGACVLGDPERCTMCRRRPWNS